VSRKAAAVRYQEAGTETPRWKLTARSVKVDERQTCVGHSTAPDEFGSNPMRQRATSDPVGIHG
jgi:hypothetical protein